MHADLLVWLILRICKFNTTVVLLGLVPKLDGQLIGWRVSNPFSIPRSTCVVLTVNSSNPVISWEERLLAEQQYSGPCATLQNITFSGFVTAGTFIRQVISLTGQDVNRRLFWEVAVLRFLSVPHGLKTRQSESSHHQCKWHANKKGNATTQWTPLL